MDSTSPDEYDERASEYESEDDGTPVKNESPTTSPSKSSSATGKAQAVKGHSHLQKRRRVTRACDECRRKKIKCDGKQPCTHCTVYSYDCTYDQPSNRRRNPAPQYVENLEHRVHRAETLLHILIPNLDLNDPGIDAAVAQGWIPGAPGKGDPIAAQEKVPKRPPPAPRDNSKSDTNLESMVRAVANIEMDEQGNWDYHGHSSGLAFVRRMKDQLGDLMGPETATTPFVKSRPYSQVLDSPRSLMDSPADVMAQHVDLPPKDVARQVCSHAIDDASVLMRVVHKPTFWHCFERLYSTPPDQYTNEDNKFLPLFFSSMALGSLFGKEGQRLDQNGYESATQQGFTYFKNARHLMDIGDVRDLPSLQAVMLMILFLQSSAKLSQCYAYVGVALRSAIRMGLHRAYSGNFDPLEAEIRKRMFWVIRKMDIYVGAMLGLPQMLSDEDVDQEYPAEVDDEYITKDGIRPMPEGDTVSVMTAFNAHTRLVTILQKIVRNVYPIKVQARQGYADKSYTVPFSVIREIEGDMEDWKNSLPPILSPCPAPERFTRIQQLLRLSYAHAQVMLYRPFLHFVAADKRGPDAKPVDQRAYACAASYVNVSRNIVHITTNMKERGLLNGAHWFIMYTAFFSVLSLVYFATENPENATTQAVMRDAIEGATVLKQLAKRSLAADRCSATLETVFSRLPDWMRNGRPNPIASKKRAYGSGAQHQTPPPGPQASRSHPDVSSVHNELRQGMIRRASTFPNHNANNVKMEQHSGVDSPWSQSGASSFGPHTPTTNAFGPSTFSNFAQTNGSITPGIQQYSLLPEMSNPALPDLSAMMFPPSDEPFGYPNQPLTTFENNQQFAKNNPYYLSQDYGGMENSAHTPTRNGHDENMEAQFFALPSYIEQGQQQQNGQRPASHHQQHHQQQRSMNLPTNAMGFTPGVHMGGVDPMGMHGAGSWNGQQSMPPVMSNINIQDIFGGAEFNPMFMGHQ